MHVSLAPTLNVLIGQLISAVLDSLGFFPAPTLRQNALPLGEYSPLPLQAVHATPVSLLVPAGHGVVPVLVSFGTVPGNAPLQEEAPSREYSPSPSQLVHDTPLSLLVPGRQGVVPVLSPFGIKPGNAFEQIVAPASEYSPSPTQAAQLLLPPRLALPASQSMHALVVSATALLPAPHSSQEDWPAID